MRPSGPAESGSFVAKKDELFRRMSGAARTYGLGLDGEPQSCRTKHSHLLNKVRAPTCPTDAVGSMALTATIIEFREVPIRAALAHAVRCARRVQHLYVLEGGHPVHSCIEAIDETLNVAARFAAGVEVDAGTVERVGEAAILACQAAIELQKEKAAAYVANAAYAIIDATKTALRLQGDEANEEAAELIVDGLAVAFDATLAADPSLENAIRDDWDKLKTMNLGAFPKLGAPIDALTLEAPQQPGSERTDHAEAATGRERTDAVVEPDLISDGDDIQPKADEAVQQPPGDIAGEAPTDQQSQQLASVGDEAGSSRLAGRVARLHRKLRGRKRQLDAERARLHGERDTLAENRVDLERQLEQLEAQRAEFSKTEAELDVRREQLQAEQQRQAAEKESLDQRERELLQKEQSIAAQQEDLQAEEERLRLERDAVAAAKQKRPPGKTVRRDGSKQLDKKRKALEKQTAQLQTERAEFDARSDRLKEKAQQLRRKRHEFASRLDDLQTRELQLTEAAQTLKEDQRQWETRRAQYETESAEADRLKEELQARLNEVEQQKETLLAEQKECRSMGEALQHEQTQLRNDKADFARQEAELHEAMRRLDEERGHLAAKMATDSRDESLAWDFPDPAQASVAQQLQAVIHGFQQERQQLVRERARLNDELTRLRQRKADWARELECDMWEDGTSGDRGKTVAHLRMVVEPGSAGSIQMAELFCELSRLCRMVGGPGIRIQVRETRVWNEPCDTAADTADTPHAGGYQRELVDLNALPCPPPGQPGCRPDTAVWSRFRSCLLEAVRSDSRLANFFELAEPMSDDNDAFDRIRQAARRAFNAFAAQRDHTGPDDAGQLVFDSVRQQQQLIADLLTNLRSEAGFDIELAPEIRPRQKKSWRSKITGGAKLPAAASGMSRRFRRFAVWGAIASAAVAVGALFLWLVVF